MRRSVTHEYGRRVASTAVKRALVWLDRAPAWTLVIAFLAFCGAVAAWMLTGHSEGALPLVILLGVYAVAAYRPAPEVLVTAAGTAIALVIVLLGDAPGFGAPQLMSTCVAYGAAMLIGWIAQSRRHRIAALESEQAEAALRAAADERLRIARELHDVVAHSLGVIAVQASVGMQVLDADPDEARHSLENISRASRSSLAEIRRLLGVVRKPEGAPAYAPAPGLVDLDRLVQEMEGAGLAVDFGVEGDTDRVPPGVGLAAYRIVQEALSNTLRHARASRATVRLNGSAQALSVEVTDDGRGPNGKRPAGYGLVGMRERVAVYGGSLDAGPVAGGGFRVAARLPYDEDPP
jgi:signal transduction histidine kinase